MGCDLYCVLLLNQAKISLKRAPKAVKRGVSTVAAMAIIIELI